MLHAALISVHAAAGVLGLLLGVSALRPPGTSKDRRLVRRTYYGALVALLLFLLAVIAVDWPKLPASSRAIFTGLAGLGFVIVARAHLALQAVRHPRPGWRGRYMDHMYFTYISLWEGFLIVGGIDLGLPGWIVAVVAIAALGIGGVLFGALKHRVLETAH